MSDNLIIWDAGPGLIGVKRGDDQIVVPEWAAQLAFTGFSGNEDTAVRLYEKHIHEPDDVALVIEFVRICVGSTREDIAARLGRFVNRRLH